MHPDIKRLNKQEPHPKGYNHPAYQLSGSGNSWSILYLDDGNWNMPIRSFTSKELALCYVL